MSYKTILAHVSESAPLGPLARIAATLATGHDAWLVGVATTGLKPSLFFPEALGAPVVGDPIYGSGGPHTLLHAAELTVPREGKDPIVAVAPLPERFVAAGFSLPSADAPVPPVGEA